MSPANVAKADFGAERQQFVIGERLAQLPAICGGNTDTGGRPSMR